MTCENQKEREMTKPLCIYHGNCADGFTAAWAVWKRFGDAWDYHAGIYGNAPPDVGARDVVIVDFSYKRRQLEEMRQRAASVAVLDHHKTAAEDLAPGGNFISMSAWANQPGDLFEKLLLDRAIDLNEGARSVQVLFDMDRSGAGIAWDFFHHDKPRHPIVNYVEDRDLWRFALPQSRDFSANLFSLPYDFHAWDRVALAMDDDRKRQAFLDEGGAIERKHHKDVAELVGACKRRMFIGGVEVFAASLPYTLTSDAGHLMAQGEPFAACYWDTPEGRVFSLRSTDDGADVSEIAKLYGGGGHKHASGFRVTYGNLKADGSPILPEIANAPA